MSIAVPLPGLAATFAQILDGLSQAVAARMSRPPRLPLTYFRPSNARPIFTLMLLLYTRLRRMSVRFAALAARAKAGTLGPRPLRPLGPPRPARGGEHLPRGIGWLIPLLPYRAAGYGGQLNHLLSRPEMKALLDAAPQARRMLRPLCRMLAIPEPAPVPPRRPRPLAPPPAATDPSAGASPDPSPDEAHCATADPRGTADPAWPSSLAAWADRAPS